MKSDFKSMLSVVLNSNTFLQKEFFSSVPVCESTVLHKSTEGFYGSCWEKMPDRWGTQDWLLLHDNTPCITDSWLLPVPNQKKKNGSVIWHLYFPILVFMAYSGSQRKKHFMALNVSVKYQSQIHWPLEHLEISLAFRGSKHGELCSVACIYRVCVCLCVCIYIYIYIYIYMYMLLLWIFSVLVFILGFFF